MQIYATSEAPIRRYRMQREIDLNTSCERRSYVALASTLRPAWAEGTLEETPLD